MGVVGSIEVAGKEAWGGGGKDREGGRKREWEVGLGNLSEIDKCRK